MESATAMTMRQVTPAKATGLPKVTDATNRLGLMMLSKTPTGVNQVVSPSSLATALAMLAAGADGKTLAELEAALGATGEARVDAFAALRGALASLDGDPALVQNKELPENPLVHLAAQVVVKDGFEVNDSYLKALADGFGAGVQRADLSGEAGKKVLSEWINHHTGGLIKETAITPNPDLRLVLQDAILLAARWQAPFKPEATGDHPFTKADGSEVLVPTMISDHSFAYAEVDGWAGVRLPYVGGRLYADVVLPPVGKSPSDIDPATLTKLSQKLGAATPEPVDLWLPKLDLKSKPLDLKDTFAGLGFTAVSCEGSDIDFSGISEKSLCVQQAMQQAVLTVDEDGTKAAAVTEIGMAETALIIPEHTLHLDRPFLVRIADGDTDWTLFLANVADPSSK